MTEIILTTLFGFASGVIGYLLNELKNAKGVIKSIRALVLGIVVRVLDDEKAEPKTRKLANEAINELKKIP